MADSTLIQILVSITHNASLNSSGVTPSYRVGIEWQEIKEWEPAIKLDLNNDPDFQADLERVSDGDLDEKLYEKIGKKLFDSFFCRKHSQCLESNCSRGAP